MRFEHVLDEKVGFGRYQMLLCFMVSWYGIPSGTNVMGPVFQAHSMDHWCAVKDWNQSCKSINEAGYVTDYPEYIPYDNTSRSHDKCNRYEFLGRLNGNSSLCLSVTEKKIPCDQGYQYDRSLFTETVVSEFNLVCDRWWIKSLSTSLYMAGIFLSALVVGNLCDRYGRKLSMAVTSTGALITLVVESLSPNAVIFCVASFFLGFFSAGVTLSSFVYILEITPANWRARVGMASQTMFGIGYITMSGVSYGWRNWRRSMQITTTFFVPFLIFLFFIPESPRWLLVTGKQEQALKSIDPLHDTGTSSQGGRRKYTTIDLFKYPGLRKLTFLIMFIWFVDSFLFYGISLNAGALNGNIFLNHTLNGIMQIAGYFICYLTMDRLGRRTLLLVSMVISFLGLGVSTVIKIYVADAKGWATFGLIAAFSAKFGISGAYAVTYNYTTELYPTVIRSCGLGIGSMSARLGGVLAPFIIELNDYLSWLPNTVFAVFAILAALVTIALPETSRQEMKETISEAEEFIKANQASCRI